MKRFTKWIVIAAVALSIVVSTAGCTSNTANPSPYVAQNMAKYDSGNFTINYPSTWNYTKATGNPSRDEFYAYPGVKTEYPEHDKDVYVRVYSFLVNETLSSFTANRVSTYTDLGDVKQIEDGNATLAGNPASKIVWKYIGGVNQGARKAMEIWTVKEGRIYWITYNTMNDYKDFRPYDIYADNTQKMIDSFKIK